MDMTCRSDREMAKQMAALIDQNIQELKEVTSRGIGRKKGQFRSYYARNKEQTRLEELMKAQCALACLVKARFNGGVIVEMTPPEMVQWLRDFHNTRRTRPPNPVSKIIKRKGRRE
jgi:hypothetical protein